MTTTESIKDSIMKYDFTTQAQIRSAFWQGNEHLKHYIKSKTQNDYAATIRTEFVEFIDMLERSKHISPKLANKVTL
tara:strand:- start:543 stop:773 length:231 start_codon:yes stop_codon:yes gene_type:complete